MQLFNLVRAKTWLAWLGATLVMCVTALGGAEAPSDLILDLFVKKGFVTQQEAARVKAEAEALRTNEMQMPALPESKWKISKTLKDVELFGDVRLRYEDRSAEDPGGGGIDLQRFRYSVRVGLRGDLFDDFYYGVRVDTGDNPRSAWASFGTSSSSTAYQGPFGKSQAGINVGLAYLGWHPWDWVDLTVGKMPNPLYTTPMVWDSDLNPEGVAERFKYAVGPADFFATFGQFIYATFAPNSDTGFFGISSLGNGGQSQNLRNIFQLAWQAGLKYHFTTNVSAKVAATVYQYIGLQRSFGPNGTSLPLSPYFGDPYIGEGAYLLYPANQYALGYSGYPNDGVSIPGGGYGSRFFPFNQVGLNDLLVLELPFEFDFKVWKLDARLFGDFAYNLEGAQRAQDATAAYTTLLASAASTGGTQTNASPFSPQKNDVKAYQIGLDLASPGGIGLISGASARRHAWEFKTYWQHVEQYALDPNLLDSDFFEGSGNLEGIYVALAYGLTDHLIATVRYGHASRINDLLGTGGSNQDLPWINPINSYDLYQVDLTFKF